MCFYVSYAGAETFNEPVHTRVNQHDVRIAYGFTTNAIWGGDYARYNLSVAAQLNSYNLAQDGTGYAFGVAQEAWNSPTGTATIHLIGSEQSVVSRNPYNQGAKAGLTINIKNRPDGSSQPAAGLGDDCYNCWSRGIQIGTQKPSVLGETMGWWWGIQFRNGSITSGGSAIDFTFLDDDTVSLFRFRDRGDGKLKDVYIENGQLVIEEWNGRHAINDPR